MSAQMPDRFEYVAPGPADMSQVEFPSITGQALFSIEADADLLTVTMLGSGESITIKKEHAAILGNALIHYAR